MMYFKANICVYHKDYIKTINPTSEFIPKKGTLVKYKFGKTLSTAISKYFSDVIDKATVSKNEGIIQNIKYDR